MHILEGLKIAIDFIDEVIRIIRASKDQPSARAALMERFGLDEVQAQAIVQMRLGQLTNMERHKIEDEIAALQAKIKDFLEILASETRKLEIVKEELIAIRNKYADPRRTERPAAVRVYQGERESREPQGRRGKSEGRRREGHPHRHGH